MAIRRYDEREKERISSLWLYEFGYDLEKNASDIDFLKEYILSIQKSKKFNSIDEKLADIRERVGFDLARKISNEVTGDKSATACCKPCGVKKNASANEVAIMGNILKYIQDMVLHEKSLSATEVIARCKDDEGLRYRDIEERIDQSKLLDYVSTLVDDDNNELTKYVPHDSSNDELDITDTAEYYNHAEPER